MDLSIDAILSAAQKRTMSAIEEGLRERLRILGKEGSGLYTYYVRKLEHHALLSQSDLLALVTLQQHAGQFQRLWEVGAGVGQLTALLAVEGWDVVTMEANLGRRSALEAVLAILERIDAPARRRVRVLQKRFPEAAADEDVSQDAVIVLCNAHTIGDEDANVFRDALAQFRFGVIDFPHLFTPSESQEDWRRRAEDYAQRYGVGVSAVGSYELTWVNRVGELFFIEPSV